MPRKAKQRLDGWDNRLWEARAFLFSTADEFDDWCQRVRAVDVCGKAVSKAAEFFHLDEQKAAHRKLLLFILADVLFGDPRRTGRSKKWQGRTYQLMRDRAQVTNGDDSISDVRAARMMKEQFRDRYRHDQPGTLRKQLSMARQKFERREARERWLSQLIASGAKRRALQQKTKPAEPVQ